MALQTPVSASYTYLLTVEIHAGARGTASPNRGYRPPNLAVLLTHCGQLILREKLVNLTPPDVRLKFAKFDFRWGSVSDAVEGAYSAPPDSLDVFKGAYF